MTPWLLSQAERTPRAPALELGDRTLDFATLAGEALHVAGCLAEQGVAPGHRVAVRLSNGLPLARLIHGLALAGAILVPIHPRLTDGEARGLLQQARADWLFQQAGDGSLGEAGSFRARSVAPVGCPVCGGEPAAGAPDRAVAPDPKAIAAVLFTSGTSGRAKGACLPWSAFEASAAASAERLGSEPGDRWLACMPLCHVGGLSILWRSALQGSCVRLQPRFEPGAVDAALSAGDVSLVSLVPTMLRRLLELRGDRPAPTRLRAVLLGGAAADPVLLRRAAALGFPVCPTYGLTEAASQVATVAPGRFAALAEGSVGPPLSGTRLRIADAAGAPLPAGTEGEILVRGPTLMAGYLHDPEASARSLRDGWLHTGDVGVLDRDGNLRVLDRRDDLVVSGGENVYPAEVEAALLAHPDVADAGVAGLPDPDLGQRVAAWVVERPGRSLDPESLAAHCNECLAGFKRPRVLFRVTALPRSTTGKLLRRRLRAPAGEEPQSSVWNSASSSR